MRSLLVTTFAASLAVLAPAHAAFTVSGSVGGAPTGVTFENFDSLPLGAGGGVTPTGITVSFGGTAQAVQGSLAGAYAAPFLSGGNGTGFGPGNSVQPNGVDATTYLTSGNNGTAGVTLQFAGPQQYLGLLWGSVDANNVLEFFNGATSVGTVTGLDVAGSPSGDQGVNGTLYVNINSTLDFDRVVATRPSFAFEFDNIAYNRFQVPAPAALALFGLGVAGLAMTRRR